MPAVRRAAVRAALALRELPEPADRLRVHGTGRHRGDAVAHSENATRCAVLTAMGADVSVEACQLGSVG
jgi:hypothetical protein